MRWLQLQAAWRPAINTISAITSLPTPARARWRSANKLRGSKTGSDAAGNMLSYAAPFAGYSFTYDARNRQTEAFVGAIGTSFLINGLGQRIAQSIKVLNVSVPQFFFVHDEAGHLTGKYDGLGTPLWETVWLGDLPAAVLLQPSGRSYIAPDHLGSPHQITDANGVVVWLWHPDPFGNGDPSGAFSYELRFPGQYFDQATRLHYNYFRDYDPRTGRYIESDPVGLRGGINTYAYVEGNPLGRIDPQGLAVDFNICVGACIGTFAPLCLRPGVAYSICALCLLLPPPLDAACLGRCVATPTVNCVGLISAVCVAGCGVATICTQ